MLDDLGFDWKPESSLILKQARAKLDSQTQQKPIKSKPRHWSLEEDSLLIRAHFLYGCDWVKIASQVKSRNNQQCLKHAPCLLPKHSYTSTKATTWFYYNTDDGCVYGPFNSDAMRTWVIQPGVTGDMAISCKAAGPFGPLGMFFTDISKAFLVTDEITDTAEERNALIEEKATKFWK